MPQKRVRNGVTYWAARYRRPDGSEAPQKIFPTRRDAKAYEDEKKAEVRRGDWIDPSGGEITLGQLTDDWIHRSRVANTIAGRKTFRKQLGDLEDVPIGALTPMHFREWEYQLRNGRPWRDGKPLAETTVNGYVREMRSMLTTAVNEERIRRNPARNLKARKVTRRISPDEVLTVDLVNDMIERFETGRRRMTKAERAAARRGELDAWAGMNAVPEMGYVVRMAAAMGPRPSELLDIRLEDIDVARGTVHLRGTKSDAAPRTIGVPADAIKAMRRRAAEYPTKEGFVMMRSDGRRMTLQWIEQRFRAVRESMGLPDSITPHSMRHFHATALIAAGVDVKAVQHRLGHSSAAVTLDIYAHWWPTREDYVVDAAARILEGQLRGNPGIRAVDSP